MIDSKIDRQMDTETQVLREGRRDRETEKKGKFYNLTPKGLTCTLLCNLSLYALSN